MNNIIARRLKRAGQVILWTTESHESHILLSNASRLDDVSLISSNMFRLNSGIWVSFTLEATVPVSLSVPVGLHGNINWYEYCNPYAMQHATTARVNAGTGAAASRLFIATTTVS